MWVEMVPELHKLHDYDQKVGRASDPLTTGDSSPRTAALRRSPGSTTRSSRPVSRPLTPLIGREHEVQEAVTLLRSPEVRLLTITGTGGIGKSRLASQVAVDVQGGFPDGYYFVELAYCTTPEQVERRLAQALGFRAKGRELLEGLKSFLYEKHLLLLLDNFEQVPAAAPLLPELLAACPQLKIVVTSRVVLRVQGEFEFPVLPLAVPDLEQLPAPAALLQYGAVALFVQRAQAITREFGVTQENARDIAAICVKLDGLPLALELAAAQTKLLTPHQLLVRLEKPLQVLTRGRPDLPVRQQTLRNTIAWSYELLTSQEQRVFRRLAFFVGGCTLEAAEAVCNGLGEVSTPVLDIVASLLDQSLLQQVKQDREATRLLLLETIRQYGLERLEASRELESTRQAHAAYYLALAEQAEPVLSQSPWLDQLEQERDNLSTALGWLLERQGVEEALRLAGALRQFWFLRGYLNEGRGFLERAVAAMRDENVSVSPQVKAKALYALGSLAYWQSDFEPARRLAQESLGLFRQREDMRGMAVALRLLGIIESGPGNDDAASDAFFAESLGLFREAADAMGTAATLLTLGMQAFFRGEFARAQELWEESLSLFRSLGDAWHLALTLHYLGWVSYCQGAYATARHFSEESVALFKKLGNPGGYAIQALTTLANEVAALEEETTAASLLQQALVLAKQGESWEERARTLCGLGRLALRQGNRAQAHARYGESLEILRGVWITARLTARTKWIPASCLEGLGEIAFSQGQIAWAVRLFGAAETLRVAGAYHNPIGREQPSYGRTLQAARSQLGEETFAALWAGGQAMTPEEVLAVQKHISGSEQVYALTPGNLTTTSPSPFPSGLTMREVEVLRLLADELTYKQIAERLVISPKTVNIHVASIYRKLGVTTRTAATLYAIKQHLI
jgi:predicted ATPase/DNA-binding CsgD family transcriptional regulator